MRYFLISLIIMEILALGFYAGQTYSAHEVIERQEFCKLATLKKEINLDNFFDMKMKELSKKSIFIHAQAAVSSQYQACLFAN